MASDKPQALIRMTAQDKKAFKAAAERDGRTLTAWINLACKEKLARRRKPELVKK